MEDYISFQSGKYLGKGGLKFDNSANLDCDFEFMFRNDGKSSFETVLYMTNDNCEIILDLLYSEKIPFASFEGNVMENGKIEISRMALDGGNIDGSTLGLPNLDRYKIRDDLLRKILSVLGAEKHIESYRNAVFTSRLRFLLLSQVTINYENCSDSDIITSVTALSNFQFGPRNDNSNPILPNIETFNVKVENIEITFERKSDYHKIISQSVFNRNSDVTSTASIDIKKSNIDHATEVLNKICMLLSFSNDNWVTPVYTDYLKKNKTVITIFHKNKTYNFNNSKFLIDPRTSPYTRIIDYLTRSYKKYDELVRDFRIHKVIEYYISAQTNSIEQEKFAIGYIALEVLCNSIPSYAKKKGEKIKPRSIQETYDNLKEVFQEMKLGLTDNQIQHITDKIAYKKVTIKDSQRYILNALSLETDDDLINDLYDIRNKLYHGADYDSNYKELVKGTTELFDLLDRIILSMFGLTGIIYNSKILNYKQTKL